MARTAIAIGAVAKPYLNPTLTPGDTANGMSIAPPSGAWALLVKNDAVATKTLTFITYATVEGLAVADEIVTVPASSIILIPAKSVETYRNPTSSLIEVDVSNDTDLDLGVIRL